MLVIERSKNGRSVVTFKKDWNIGRLSAQYYANPKQKYHWLDTDACKMQTLIRDKQL